MGKWDIELEHFDYDTKEMVSDGKIPIRAIARSLDPEQFACLLGEYCDCFGAGYPRGRETGEFLKPCHPTCQRLVIAELVGIVAGLSEASPDPRNEQAIELAEEIEALYEEIGAGPMV